MKRFQDFFYDKNDIIIALLILCIAGLIIMWRIEVIMDYPQTLAKETGTVQTTEDAAVDTDKATEEADADTTDDDTPDQVWMAGELTHDITISIAGGSAMVAVDGLVSAGLFDSYDDFAEVCKAAGRSPEDIKANTFTFEKGSTQTDIAKQVTD
ncbi:MAG: hypothetical protein IKJ77_01860 [Firmicutes bacterium]|nr:hypothetical protein [Bacillota bacterium]